MIQRIVAPLQHPLPEHRAYPPISAVPIDEPAWTRGAQALAIRIGSLAEDLRSPGLSFHDLSDWVTKVTHRRWDLQRQLHALAPFEPFDATLARTITADADKVVAAAAHALLSRTDAASCAALTNHVPALLDLISATSPDPLAQAFGMPEAPRDANGECRPEWVLQHYAYRTGDLLSHVLPQLVSLGLGWIPDSLVAVTVIGLIVDSEDPIAAYVAMDLLAARFLDADPDIAQRVKRHLHGEEPSIARANRGARRARTAAATATTSEDRADALADAYKRVIEGPFRQHAWAARCLVHERWESVPMLSNLRERLSREGGLLAKMAESAIITEFRNGETHETLHWDGIAEEFVTPSARLTMEQIVHSTVLATALSSGFEAAHAAIRTLDLTLDHELPSPGQEGRAPAWQRARAYFGTNNLHLIDADLNTKNASITLRSITGSDINPCFQALHSVRRLLPGIETFTIRTAANDGPVIAVDATAIDASMATWTQSLRTLDRTPLATFLPVNLAARRQHEDEATALRSVAWIAVDDILDAVDGSAAIWEHVDRRTISARLSITESALAATASTVDKHNVRLDAVQDELAELHAWLVRENPAGLHEARSLASLRRLREQWQRWGPVPRLPGIPEVTPPETGDPIEPPPALSTEPKDARYRSI